MCPNRDVNVFQGLKAPAGAQIARAISKEEMQLRLQQHQLSQKGVTVGGTTVAQLHHPQTGQVWLIK